MLHETTLTQITSFLSTRNARDTAGLLDGPWGSGKTRLLREIIEKYQPEDVLRKVAYVTCYGAEDLRDLDRQLFSEAHSYLGSRNTVAIGRILSVLPQLGGLKDFTLVDLINRSNFDLVVFDDIERSHIAMRVLLGYINSFVEHSDCKVLCAASVSDMNDSDGFGQYREKTFGRSFSIQVREEEVAELFELTPISPDSFLQPQHLVDAAGLFVRSGLANLRVYRQAVMTTATWMEEHRPDWRTNEAAVWVWLRTVIAVFLEVRCGQTRRSDVARELTEPYSTMRASTSSEAEKSSILLEENFKNEGILLYERITRAAMCLEHYGFVSEHDVKEGLVEKGILTSGGRTDAPWATLSTYFLRDTAQVERAIELGIAALKNKQEMPWAELLHLTSALIYFAELGATPIPASDVLRLAQNYADYYLDCLEKIAFPWFSYDVDNMGYSHMEIKDEELLRMFNSLTDSTRQKYCSREAGRLKISLRDPRESIPVLNKFMSSIAFRYGLETELFNDTSAKELADKLVRLDTPTSYQFLRGLAGILRSEKNREANTRDLEFLKKVSIELERTTAEMSGSIRRIQLTKLADIMRFDRN